MARPESHELHHRRGAHRSGNACLRASVHSAEDPYDHPLVGGAIYLDGILQAEITPDTIVADAGEHWVKVEFQNFFADSLQVQVIADSLVQAAVVLSPLNPDVGIAAVMAGDSASGMELIGAEIFLDGASTGLFTPDTLPNIPVGTHLIGTGLLGYDYREVQVDVTAGFAAQIQVLLPSVPWNGIRIVTNANIGRVCVDERLLDVVTPWVVAGFPDGPHSFSCYQDSHATVHNAASPALLMASLFLYGHTEITFNLELWAAGIGYQEGKLAPAFELESDQSDTIALGGLRGRVVLVTFWFRDCVPCMQELPYIQQVYSELGGQGFRVLSVNPMFNDN
ncbi:MAG TPA: redoxin domain-containing protein, partial [bacterium]